MSEPEEFHLPIKEITKETPMLVRGVAKDVLEKIDNMDLNKDGKRDVAQIAAVGLGVLPILSLLDAAIDFDAAAELLAETKVVKDKPKFAQAIKLLGKLLEQVNKED